MLQLPFQYTVKTLDGPIPVLVQSPNEVIGVMLLLGSEIGRLGLEMGSIKGNILKKLRVKKALKLVGADYDMFRDLLTTDEDRQAYISTLVAIDLGHTDALTSNTSYSQNLKLFAKAVLTGLNPDAKAQVNKFLVEASVDLKMQALADEKAAKATNEVPAA